MNIRILSVTLAALASSAALGFPTMKFLDTVDGRSIKMSLNSGNSYQKVFAGELKMKLSYSGSLTETVIGFCADPHTRMSSGTYWVTITDTTEIAQVGGKVGHLINTFAPVLLDNGSDTDAMALQVAIWEVLVETSGTYDVTKGKFRAKQSDGDSFSSSELAAINGYLNSMGTGTARYYLSDLDNDCDPKSQSILTPVPEPATLGVLAIGALAMVRRRKR
jgi:hypothetical protein